MKTFKRVKFNDNTIHWKTESKFVKYKARKISDIYKERDNLIIDLGYKTYNDYLFSLLWKDIRKRVLKRDNYQCKVCGDKSECVHHTKYNIANLSGRSIKFMVSLCHDCHHKIEFTPSGQRRNLDKSLRLLKDDIRAGKINSHLCKVCSKLSVKGSNYCRKCKSGRKSKKYKRKKRKRKVKKIYTDKECVCCKRLKQIGEFIFDDEACNKCVRKKKDLKLYCIQCTSRKKRSGSDLCRKCAKFNIIEYNKNKHKGFANNVIITESTEGSNKLKNRLIKIFLDK